MEIDPIIIYVLKFHDLQYTKNYISFPKGIFLLKVQEKQETNSQVLKIDPYNYIIYVLKLPDAEDLDDYISFSKGISLLKVMEKERNHSYSFRDRPT